MTDMTAKCLQLKGQTRRHVLKVLRQMQDNRQRTMTAQQRSPHDAPPETLKALAIIANEQDNRGFVVCDKNGDPDRRATLAEVIAAINAQPMSNGRFVSTA